MAKLLVWLCVFLGGWAGLTWELIWLQHASLAIGVTAQATALVLVSVMLGMAVGAVLGGRLAHRLEHWRPLRVYGLLEAGIGLCGLGVAGGFAWLQKLDSVVFQWDPAATTLVNAVGCVVLLGLPAAAMGASIPVFAGIARERGLSISMLYGANVAGATSGILLTSFVIVPAVGFKLASAATACLNLLLALILLLASRTKAPAPHAGARFAAEGPGFPFWQSCLIVACTGFATFSLEIAWFRSIRAAFQATSESFALMLGSVLLSLFLGSLLSAPLKRRRPGWLGPILILSGLAILLGTPLVERIDLLFWSSNVWANYTWFNLARFGYLLLIIGIPMVLIGIALPWLMDSYRGGRPAAWLYAANTLGAVLGSLISAWVLLPGIGFVKTAWVAAFAMFLPALLGGPGRPRMLAAALLLAGVAFSHHFESGVGRLRVQAPLMDVEYSVIESSEGPDSTVSVIESVDGMRALFIDGFMASSTHLVERGVSNPASYMESMGDLPMRLHHDPQQALVICFGTGQTANAVRRANPRHVDVVDISGEVLAMASRFPKNESVLADPRVHAHVMDGRQWLRRVGRSYDAITLEPMPPTFAGTNNLYSIEFYRLARERLNDGGLMAQWLPFHLISPREMTAIVATFVAVFPDTRVWIDVGSGTGILLGRKHLAEALGSNWKLPASELRIAGQALTPVQFEAAFLPLPVLRRLADSPLRITDDNQLLSYGYGRSMFVFSDWSRANRQVIEAMQQ